MRITNRTTRELRSQLADMAADLDVELEFAENGWAISAWAPAGHVFSVTLSRVVTTDAAETSAEGLEGLICDLAYGLEVVA